MGFNASQQNAMRRGLSYISVWLFCFPALKASEACDSGCRLRHAKQNMLHQKAGHATPRCQDQTSVQSRGQFQYLSVYVYMFYSVVLWYVVMHMLSYVMSCSGM